MPQPDSTNFSVDLAVYRHILNPLSKKLCHIHPNWITLLGTFLNIPIAINLIKGGNIYTFILFGFIKIFLDCMDGAMARTCNRTTKLGAFLDIFSDSITVILVAGIILYKIYVNNKIIKYRYLIVFLSVFAILYYIMQTYNELNNKRQNDNMFKFKLDKYIHDNTLVIVPLAFYMVKRIVG